eukprot:6202990-Pleurochrysis_carterae.AAC.2
MAASTGPRTASACRRAGPGACAAGWARRPCGRGRARRQTASSRSRRPGRPPARAPASPPRPMARSAPGSAPAIQSRRSQAGRGVQGEGAQVRARQGKQPHRAEQRRGQKKGGGEELSAHRGAATGEAPSCSKRTGVQLLNFASALCPRRRMHLLTVFELACARTWVPARVRRGHAARARRHAQAFESGGGTAARDRLRAHVHPVAAVCVRSSDVGPLLYVYTSMCAAARMIVYERR